MHHTRASKKIHLGGKFPGINQKICRPPKAAGKFFRQPRRPGVENDLNFFTHGIPRGYSRGSFISTFLPGLTPLGSFSWFFLIFSEFSWFFFSFSGFFKIFFPKNLPAAFAGRKFFRPWVVDPYQNFFTHGAKSSQGCCATPFHYPWVSTKKTFLPRGAPHPLAHLWFYIKNNRGW